MSRNHLRLNRRRWEAFRLQVLERDGYRCQSCGKAGILEVDHITPLKRGGQPWELGNVQSLCRSCHFSKTGRENSNGPTPMRDAWRAFVDDLA